MSNDETIIATNIMPRPNPGGRLTPRPDQGQPQQQDLENLWERLCADRQTPLVAAALPLLGLCVRIRNSPTQQDVEGLRLRVLREIDTFERRMVPLGLPPRSMRAAKYALCATIDDLVLNSPWGSRSVWTSRSMVSSLFSETWGGDRFFDLLTQLKKDPAVNVDLLELLYYCISLGFEGRYRVAPRGAAELTVLREDVYRLIRAVRGEFERDLSPQWRGADIGQRRPGAIVPLWVMTSVAVALLLLIYTALALFLNSRSDSLFDRLASLPPAGAISLARAAPPPPAPVIVMQSDRLRRFLEPEIREGLVSVEEDDQKIKVRIKGAGMFESGSQNVISSFQPLLKRIGIAVNDEPGDILITGHTDNVPIRTLAFPSNFQLSQARAQSVASIVTAQMNDPGRVKTEGRGASEPIEPNDTDAGRQANRRIEVIITKPR